MKKATKRTICILLGVLCLAVAIWAAPKLYRAYQTERIAEAKAEEERIQADKEQQQAEAELAWTEELRQANIEYPFLDDNVVMKRYQGKDYYVKKKPYEGEYDYQNLSYFWIPNDELEEPIPGADGLTMEWHHMTMDGINVENEIREVNEHPLEEAETLQVMNYEEYVDYCEEWRLYQKYSDPKLNYIVRSFYTEPYDIDSELSGIRYDNSTAELYFYEDKLSSLSYDGAFIYIIPTDQDVDNVEVVQAYSEEEYEDILGIAPTRVPEPQ